MEFKRFILLSLCVLLCVSCKSESTEINKYDAMMVCRQDFSEEIDDENISSTSNIYIDYNDNNQVIKAIYQSISSYSSANEVNMYEQISNIYNALDGVTSRFYIVDDALILEIEYDYEHMNLDDMRIKLGNMLDSESIFMRADKLPVSLDDFKKIELENYECEVQ